MAGEIKDIKMKVAKSFLFPFILLHKFMHCAFFSNSDSVFAGSVIPIGEVIIVIIVVIIINDQLFRRNNVSPIYFKKDFRKFLPSISYQDSLDFLFTHPMLTVILHVHYFST